MIQNVLEFIGSNPIWTTAGAAVAGFAVNHLFGLVLGQFWPDEVIITAIRRVDAHIERFKLKYPEAGKQLENRVLETLDEAVAIIKGVK